MTRLEEVAQIIKEEHFEDIQIGETDGNFGYIIEGEPTIVSKEVSQNAFKLHNPSVLVKIPQYDAYVDRVQVSIFDSNEDIKRVIRLMKSRASKFKSNTGTHHNDFGFQLPGKEFSFFRELETPNIIELRYYVQSFNKQA